MAGRLRFGRAGINREGKRKSEWEREQGPELEGVGGSAGRKMSSWSREMHGPDPLSRLAISRHQQLDT